MWKHLWTHQEAPSDYVILQLCDRFGAAILQLDDELVEAILAMWEVEGQVAEAKRRNREWGKK